MVIQYVANDMKSPKGKPKVYFACHPDDFDTTFSIISKDILCISSCAIWYDSSIASPAAQEGVEVTLEQALDEMQLVVIAVTSGFLHSESEARDRVLPYALEKNIPVLPIAMENGLMNEFNRNCAEIQVVERYVTDPTATAYEDVLKTFLDSVIIGEELAERVRNAFDAYVFLSYRKKDRRYAQRLMKLIHDNEQYRDIAIWYDEYLVPGEGFNEAILKAFEKSSLFAMVVTPNLEDQDNYVMRVEYPLARRRKAEDSEKQNDKFEIVSVEMYETPDKGEKPWRIDVSNLKNKQFEFEEIPGLVDEHRLPEMNRSFIDALNKAAKKENDGSSLHRFLIGLAYLSGIDVEINHERALNLIESAAEDHDDPCMEATAKLADMYMNGEGVNRNLNQALVWQSRLASQYKTAYDREHNPDAHKGYGTAYFKALRKLSYMYMDAGKYAEAVSSAEKALGFSDKLETEVGTREQKRDKAVILNRLGKLHIHRNDYTSAEKCFTEACKIYENLASEMKTYRSRRDLSISYEHLGDMYRKKENLADSGSYYRKAESIREQLYEQTQSLASCRDLSAIMTKLGNICKSTDRFDEAEMYYGRALEFDRGLALETKTVQAWDDYGVSLVKIGDIRKATGKFEEARVLYEEALSTFRKNAEKSDSMLIQDHIAGGCEKLAEIKGKTGQIEEAETLYTEAIRIRKLQCDTINSVSSFDALARTYYTAAYSIKDTELMTKAYDIWCGLSEKKSKFEKYRDNAEQIIQKWKEA